MADYRAIAGVLNGQEPTFGQPAQKTKPTYPGVVQALEPDAFERQYQGNQANGPKPGGGIPQAWSNLTTPVGNDTGLFT